MTEPTSLYIVPTPIGNLEDITLRALRILKEVDVILAEDTRTSGFLLKHYEIKKPLQSYHAFNEHKALEVLIKRLKSGEKMALISDAGTPGISDPGFLLVRGCLENEVKVECLPGATAFVPALVNSGLPSGSFVFEGFLPQKKGRKTKLDQLAGEVRTIILYESPFRLIKTLEQLKEVLGGDRKASVSRELTKLHEETVNNSLDGLMDYFKEKNIKGEIVIVIAGSK
ncbi:MAG TPA: 16S rRNA (cytidine(1402)-2'-O)-methyltransferase [Cytophagales bacterium]|nr:16S rRNA (cytidine(1402)-2'-O)-methyltransferase [Cytophagales bacterium]